jgi:hypothetical protein
MGKRTNKAKHEGGDIVAEGVSTVIAEGAGDAVEGALASTGVGVVVAPIAGEFVKKKTKNLVHKHVKKKAGEIGRKIGADGTESEGKLKEFIATMKKKDGEETPTPPSPGTGTKIVPTDPNDPNYLLLKDENSSADIQIPKVEVDQMSTVMANTKKTARMAAEPGF